MMRGWTALVIGVVCAGTVHAGGITIDDARVLLPTAPKSCSDVECMLDAAYADDPKAKTLALALSAACNAPIGAPKFGVFRM